MSNNNNNQNDNNPEAVNKHQQQVELWKNKYYVIYRIVCVIAGAAVIITWLTH